MKASKTFDYFVQFALPGLTIGTQLATACKHPDIGLVINMIAQPFRFYSSWKGYKKAGQLGMFLTTIIFTFVTAWGIINYRLL